MLAALLVGAWIIAYELIPFDFVGEGLAHARATGRIFLLPMSGHFEGSVPNLVADVSGKLLRYAAFSWCISTLLAAGARANWRRHCLIVTTLTSAAIAALQLIHLFQPSRTCDSTNILLAAAGATITCVLLRGVQDFRRAEPRVVDDLLTGQLIEGGTYDKNAFKSLRKPRSDASLTAAGPGGPRD